MTLVMYNAEKNEFALYKTTYSNYWYGKPWIVWRSLEIAMSYGWELVGEL